MVDYLKKKVKLQYKLNKFQVCIVYLFSDTFPENLQLYYLETQSPRAPKPKYFLS